TDLGALVDAGLGFLVSQLGYESVSLYLLEESEGMLYALASRGFTESGVGARIAPGVGVVGTCAKHRMAVHVADVPRELRYGRAVKEQIARVSAPAEREIPLPGLRTPTSMLAVPLVLRGELFGVLATESERLLAYGEADAQILV